MGATRARGGIAITALPIVTTAHLPSAANNNYWPEIYTNQSLVEPTQTEYTDTPSPKTFGNTSLLDPQLFSRINDFADELLKGERSGKYSPIEVAQWLEDLAGAMQPVKAHRVDIDVAIQAGLGRFFAAKFRAGVLYAIHDRTGDRAALEEALKSYRAARAAWAGLADNARGSTFRTSPSANSLGSAATGSTASPPLMPTSPFWRSASRPPSPPTIPK